MVSSSSSAISFHVLSPRPERMVLCAFIYIFVCLNVNGGVVTGTSGAASVVNSVAAVSWMMFCILNCFFLMTVKQSLFRLGKHSLVRPIGCVSHMRPLIFASLNPVVLPAGVDIYAVSSNVCKAVSLFSLTIYTVTNFMVSGIRLSVGL